MKLVHFALPLALFLATEPVFSGDEFVDNIDEVTHAPTFESKLQQYLDSKVDEKKLWAFLASQKYMDNNGEMTSVPFAKDRGASEHELNLIVEAIDRIHHADLATIKFNNSFFGKIDNLFKGAHFATSTPEESQEAYTGQLLRYYIIAHRDDPIDVLEENLSEKGIDGNAIVAFHEKVKGITHDDRPVSPKRSPRIDAVSTQEDHSHPTRILPPKIPVP
ncbi:MAG: hypothetical protein K2X53_00185, partial [Alphaproteobacteria bacterium]|nr:hypothetical protein [Alphaproteobacteria bacterium]